MKLLFPRAGDDPASNSAVVFDADTFMNSLRSMLEVRSESKKDEDDSDDSLSISDDEGSSGLSPRKEEEEREMEELMTKMDDELSMTSIGKSFECLKKEVCLIFHTHNWQSVGLRDLELLPHS